MADPLCILTSGKILVLAISSFSLSWTHSVEKSVWSEDWHVTHGQLQVTQARVQGSGAGMDPPEGSVRTADGWTYTPRVPPLSALVLASSGVTASPWRLCPVGAPCLLLGETEGDAVKLWVGNEKGCHHR